MKRLQAALLGLVGAAALASGACQSSSKPSSASPSASSSAAPEFPPFEAGYVAGKPLAEIDLTAGVPEERVGALLSDERGTFYDLTRTLVRLREDPDGAGVMVRFGMGRIGWGRGSELARGLKALRAQGKRVVCHADDLGNSAYGVAAEGCDEVWVSPAGGVDTVGLGAELVFARDLLGKLGIEADILQVGRYKGTGEMLTRSHASDEVKVSLQGALGGLRERWLSGVEAGRPGGVARAAVERGPYAAAGAKEAGLIDGVGYAAEALASLRGKTGGGRLESAFGPQTVSGGGGGLGGILRAVSGARRSRKASALVGRGRIAVLRASGSIAMEKSQGPLGGSSGIVARPLMKQLRELADDDSVSAVVLRIDSPGGSALASDLLWFDLMRLRQSKTLVISVGDMAASGGYYLACAGHKIVAEETSIVGSIGVVGGKVALGGALAKVGVNVEVVPADSSGDARRVAYNSALVPWDDGARERALASMRSVYDLFLQRVSRGRGRPVDEVATFAEGRIFAGREALQRGMVDELGGLLEAIEVARREARLGPGADVFLAERRSSLGDLLDLEGKEDEARAALTTLPVGWLPWVGELSTHAASLGPLLSGERALVALPFVLLVR